jgi:tetratricopeptide (TPR) repeat protein
LRPDCPPDLAAICSRCLEEESERRYPSAQALAEDLNRFQRGECVTARPVSRIARCARWYARRPAVATLMTCLAAALLVGAFTSLAFWRKAAKNETRFLTEQATRAQIAEQMESTLLNLTWLAQERRFQPAANRSEREATTELLQNYYRQLRMWRAADEATRGAGQPSAAASHSLAIVDNVGRLERADLKRELLQGITAWREVIRTDLENPQWRRALALHLLTYTNCAEQEDWLWWAEPQQALTLGPQLVEEVGEPYAQLLLELGIHYNFQRNHAAAQILLTAARQLLLDARIPADSSDARKATVLLVHKELASLALSVGQIKQAVKELDSVQQLLEDFAGRSELVPRTATILAECHRVRYRVCMREADLPAAYQALQSSRRFAEMALATTPNDDVRRIELANIVRNMARLQASRNMFDEANQLYSHAVHVLSCGLTNRRYCRELIKLRATTLALWGKELHLRGDNHAAESALDQAIFDFRALSDVKQEPRAFWLHYVESLQSLGQIFGQADRVPEAIKLYEESIELLDELKSRLGNRARYPEAVKVSRDELNLLRERLPN